MATDVAAMSDSLSKTITNVCKEFERSWTDVFELAECAKSETELVNAMKRLVAYNPSNKTIEALPNVKLATDMLRQIIVANSLKAEPGNAEAFITLGHCYLSLNDFPNAYTAYKAAMAYKENINDQWFYYGVGCVHAHFDFLSEAQRYLSRVTNLQASFPYESDVRLRLALLDRGKGSHERALHGLRSLLANPPPKLTKEDIQFQIAFTNQLAGHVEEAAEIYAKLYEQFPNTTRLTQQ